MNRKERRKEITPTRIHAKFLYSEKKELPVRFETKADGRTTAYVTVEGYASTKVKDWSGDVINPQGIDLSRFDAWNAPLKAMHWRWVISNVGVIKSARVDDMWLYIVAEARLDVSKDANWRYINEQDYTLYDRLMNRTINGFSVWFHNIVEWRDKELNANYIQSMTLHEVSLVDVPDNPLTIVKMLELHHDLSSHDQMKKKFTPENVVVKQLLPTELVVGNMYRIQIIETDENAYIRDPEVEVKNVELVKIDMTESWDPMCYFLEYELQMDWWVACDELVIRPFSQIQIVELTPEQLKELNEERIKDLEEEQAADENVEEVTEGEEEEKELDTESQESETVWNDGDASEQDDVDEGEKILAGTKDLETQAGVKVINDLQKRVKELEDQNVEVQQENEQLQADLEEAEKMFNEVFEDNKSLRAKLNKVLAIKSIKVEHGLKQVEDKEVKKGNVAIAVEEAFKQF